MKLKVHLKSSLDVKKFVEITSQYPENLTLVHDRYVVDAKSILGILSLDLQHPVDLVSPTDNRQLAQALEAFIPA